MDNTEAPAPELVRRADAARELGISERTLDRYRERGLLPEAETARPGVWVFREHVDALRIRPDRAPE